VSCGYCDGKCAGKDCNCPCHFDPCPTCGGEGQVRKSETDLAGRAISDIEQAILGEREACAKEAEAVRRTYCHNVHPEAKEVRETYCPDCIALAIRRRVSIGSSKEAKMTSHTPGPWEIKPRVHAEMFAAIMGADGHLVVNLGDGGNGIEQQTANGHLIAAAPDLLAALEVLLGRIETRFLGEVEKREADQARAAIAKAKGKAVERT